MAVKLARTFALQAETLAKLQRGGEQVVKVVHVHPGAQAVIGNVTAGTNGAPPGEGASHENRNRPHAKAELPAPSAEPMPEMRGEDAGAGSPCRSPAVAGKARCRMHGGALGSGGPTGKRNGRYRLGWHTRDMIAERRQLAELIRETREFDRMIRG